MTQFVNNNVQSGNIIYASDHNEQGVRIANVLNGNIGSDNLTDSSVVNSKIADGAVSSSKMNWSTLGTTFFSSNSTSLTFTAPYYCTIKVKLSMGCWGFAGNKFSYYISTPAGLAEVIRQWGVTQGHDTVPYQTIAEGVYANGVAGTSYTFGLTVNEGQLGGQTNPIIWAECIRMGA